MNLQKLRRRIRTARGTVKLTKAMEAVAQAKLSKSIAYWRGISPYSDEINALLGGVKIRAEDAGRLEYVRELSGRKGLLVLGSEKGLCGGFNAVLRERMKTVDSVEETVVVGTKMWKNVGERGKLVKGMGKIHELEVVSGRAMEEARRLYQKGLDVVVLSFRYHPHKSRPDLTPLLPVEVSVADEFEEGEYEFFHDPIETLSYLIERSVKCKLTKLLVESFCAEQEHRAFAMRNATENGKELIKDLSLTYHRMRQRKITDEIADVVRGTEGGVM